MNGFPYANPEELFNTYRDDYLCENYVRKQDLPDLQEMALAVSDLIEIIYGSGPMDHKKVDELLGYLADEFDLDVPAEGPKIERKRNDLNHLES